MEEMINLFFGMICMLVAAGFSLASFSEKWIVISVYLGTSMMFFHNLFLPVGPFAPFIGLLFIVALNSCEEPEFASEEERMAYIRSRCFRGIH